MITVMACVLKNVIRPTSPGGYDDGFSKMTKPDGYICSHVVSDIHVVKCIPLWPIYIHLI